MTGTLNLGETALVFDTAPRQLQLVMIGGGSCQVWINSNPNASVVACNGKAIKFTSNMGIGTLTLSPGSTGQTYYLAKTIRFGNY